MDEQLEQSVEGEGVGWCLDVAVAADLLLLQV
jgi:hypothetical protein